MYAVSCVLACYIDLGAPLCLGFFVVVFACFCCYFGFFCCCFYILWGFFCCCFFCFFWGGLLLLLLLLLLFCLLVFFFVCLFGLVVFFLGFFFGGGVVIWGILNTIRYIPWIRTFDIDSYVILSQHLTHWDLKTIIAIFRRLFRMDIFKWKLFNLALNSIDVCSGGPIDNMSPLVLVMAWSRTGDKPLHKPIILTKITCHNVCMK